jgi:hypothetical protein
VKVHHWDARSDPSKADQRFHSKHLWPRREDQIARDLVERLQKALASTAQVIERCAKRHREYP